MSRTNLRRARPPQTPHRPIHLFICLARLEDVIKSREDRRAKDEEAVIERKDLAVTQNKTMTDCCNLEKHRFAHFMELHQNKIKVLKNETVDYV